MLKICR